MCASQTLRQLDVNKTWLVRDGNSMGSLNLVSARSGGSGRAGRKVWKSLHPKKTKPAPHSHSHPGRRKLTSRHRSPHEHALALSPLTRARGTTGGGGGESEGDRLPEDSAGGARVRRGKTFCSLTISGIFHQRPRSMVEVVVPMVRLLLLRHTPRAYPNQTHAELLFHGPRVSLHLRVFFFVPPPPPPSHPLLALRPSLTPARTQRPT